MKQSKTRFGLIGTVLLSLLLLVNYSWGIFG